MPPRMVGLYALAQMERAGTVHGYELAQRIADRTQGAWRPSAGTIYPSLQRLVDRGLARPRLVGRRRAYRITPAGRAVLRRLRRQMGAGAPGVPDLSVLWAEVVGAADLDSFLLRRLRRSLDAISATLNGGPATEPAPLRRDGLRTATIAELSARLEELRGRGHRVAAARPRRRA